MSSRLFSSTIDNTISDKQRSIVNRQNIVVNQVVDVSNNPCYKFVTCNNLPINRYNSLRKYKTFYNNPRYDNSGNEIIYFNGNINQSNNLKVEIDISANLVKPLKNIQDYSNNTLDNYATIQINRLYIDPCGVIFDNSCNNIYYKNTLDNNGVKYYIDNENNNVKSKNNAKLDLCVL